MRAPDTLQTDPGFEARVVQFLEAATTRRSPEVLRWGIGHDGLSLFHDSSGAEEAGEVLAAKVWQARRWEAGFGWICGPREYGGAGLPAEFDRRYHAIETGYVVPDMNPLRVGLGTVSPGLVANGTPEQVRGHAKEIQAGRLVACQLFSEPDAGSDLANVRTSAVRDGGSWVLTGQKLWSSNAHLADIGLALARSDSDAPKHRGLTMFLIPMDTPGITVRPLRQITGGSAFTEVFLDGVAVTDALRVGEPGLGWPVAMSTLAAERTAVGDRYHALTARALDMLKVLATRQAGGGALRRGAIADLEIRLRVARYHQARMQAEPPDRLSGDERALDKLMLSGNLRRIGDVAGLLLGPRLAADTGEWGTFGWSRWILGAAGMRIGGGTDEILRTMIGERLLGLPREPRPAASQAPKE